MSKGLTQLHPAFMFRLETPANVAVKVFMSLHCTVWGYPRIDVNPTLCVDPWTTAMKYLDHMSMRGWEVNRVDNITRKSGVVVIVTVEKPLV